MSLESSVTELVEEASDLIQTFNSKKSEIEQAVDAAMASSIKPLQGTATYTVGPGGNFETINEALTFVRNYAPNNRNGGSAYIILTLLSGFVVQEQISLNYGTDLSYVVINAEDDVVYVDCAYLNTVYWSRKGLFTASNQARLPAIACLFEMMPEGRDTLHDGIVLNFGAWAQIQTGCGIRNAGGRGIYIASCSFAAGYAVVFSGAGVDGIAMYDTSMARFDAGDFSGAGQNGAYVSGSTLAADESDFSGAGYRGINAISLARLQVNSSNCRMVEGEDGTSDIVAQNASMISANNSLGGTNIATNTWVSNGIIYKV